MSYKTDKSALLAAERTEPMTADEHAEATGHQAELLRDRPRTCICAFMWNPAGRRYHAISYDPDCPWHVRRFPGGES